MIRVLAAIVAPPHLTVSGAGRAGEQLSLALAEHCEVTVANMMASQTGPDEGKLRRVPVKVSLPPLLPWRRVPNRYRTLFYRSNIPDLIEAGGFDLVHLHNPMPALEMARIARACRRAGVPYVISTHGFNEIANGERIYGFGLPKRLVWKALVTEPVSWAVRHAAAIFALSPADKEIARQMGFAGEALAVVPNGVPQPRPADPAGDKAIYARLGIAEPSKGRITCMFLANHTPNKGLPVLLSAFSQLDCPYQLIVGGETRAEVDYSLATAPRRPDQQIVVTGRLSDDEVAALFRRSDLFVFPTLADTFPLAILEAMSYGLPVLASNVGGIPYQIDERSGRLVAAGNAEQLADAVGRFARAPVTLAKMGRHAKARVAAQFTWESAASRAFAEYERVLSLPQTRSAPVKTRIAAAPHMQRGTPA
ncbi:glycosyltransferase family 1 protein [Bosea caraganae]|uniref:Glycosyltransferase family 1 protein n=1 Tax=Bosea caraganae TaxID=2763117 RepID=A0A370L509_9HYPH|nr:glycosyltransferase family 4 protein [Bosea caraganae]RDJ24078.1 glycosyltransferase family 1 protein [Bosea caraganae]RDJ30120.1 glycosyltransferase family 1 protein [Bosea caraganae]